MKRECPFCRSYIISYGSPDEMGGEKWEAEEDKELDHQFYAQAQQEAIAEYRRRYGIVIDEDEDL